MVIRVVFAEPERRTSFRGVMCKGRLIGLVFPGKKIEREKKMISSVDQMVPFKRGSGQCWVNQERSRKTELLVCCLSGMPAFTNYLHLTQCKWWVSSTRLLRSQSPSGKRVFENAHT